MGTSLLIEDCHGTDCTVRKPLSRQGSLDALSLDTNLIPQQMASDRQ